MTKTSFVRLTARREHFSIKTEQSVNFFSLQMQMGSLGFRSPQFSEELAWLPACLQRITDTSVEPKSPSHQQFKEFSCIQGEDSELLWKEESRCSSFRLFLSGEDNSPISSFLSSNGVLHFHLHLSSDGDSQYYQSQLLSTSTAQHGSDKVLQLRHVEISAGRGENTDQIKTKNNAGGVNALPMTSIPRAAENVGPQSSNHVKLSSERSVEKVTVRNLKSTDIKDAVELSIAASEALVIHELVKSESALEAFPTAAVLEAALQVKQARLDSSEDAFDCPTEKSDETDFLSDLDDLTMADAFEDVGLSFNGFDDQHACGSDVSLVKDTPMSENCFGCENRTENAGHFSLQNKPSNNPTSGLKNSGFPNNSDPMLHKLFLESSHVSETVQRVGFSMVDASIQPQADFNCSDLWNVENAGESNTSTYIANGFRSRWFGGWTGKEADPVQLKPKIKNIPKCFAAETSFFSESADLAPDENSFILKCEKNRYEIASDKSVLFEGLSDKVDEGIMASQEVRSSNLSVVDPLCSIVPCSISSESAGATLGQKGKTGEATAGNCFGSSAGLGNESVHVESIHETRQAPPTFGGECSAAKVRRLLTSLKTYSKVLHERDSILGSERLCLNQSTPFHLGDNNNRIRFSDKRNSDMSLAVGSIPECTIGRDIEVNRHTTLVDNPDGETMNDKKNYDEHAKDRADLQHQPSRGRSSPLIVPKRMRQRLQAARVLDCGSLRKAKAEHAVAQDVSVALNSGSSLQWIESVCNNPFDMQVPSRKRVHFSEIEVNLHQNEDLAKRQSLHQKCSASRPSKTFKQIQDSKWFSTMHFRDQKSSMFQGIKFLLTGFSSRKEKEFQGLIWKYGGIVLVDIPSPSNKGKRCSRNKFLQLPIVLCPKKLQTTKFLYACAVNSLILKDKWLSDSIAAGTALSPGKYMVLLNQNQPDTRFTRIGKPVCHDNNLYIFDGVGIMLHGKQHFCTKFAKVIQHGGGRVFKTLMWLAQNLDTEKISLAVIVSEEENRASRHLRHCASERNIPMMPSSWIVRSLYSGKLLPFVEKKHTTLHAVMGAEFSVSDTWSQEI
ncbi:uncharacterized protein LOC111295636 isoform X2 [Durio zibethinus]|uniref:Uncharacterized protein LOC111295636 isoform X2 n=1 Tax=Durio zibethinus TaxID=66656 RepID=A0A6P5YXE0_DURZI|nr:uncharacterized protein LOC111295636 isoform X2 [Durio zibethinus]